MDEQVLQLIAKTIVDELHPDEIILFGSRAKGHGAPNSDVDLLVFVPDSEEANRHRRRMEGRLYRRLAQFPVSKDILIFTRQELDHWRLVAGHVIETGLREGRQLYAR